MTVFQVGDVIRLKKPHPCGGYEWKILRIGADFRLECLTCGHTVMLPRSEVELRLKTVVSAGSTNERSKS